MVLETILVEVWVGLVWQVLLADHLHITQAAVVQVLIQDFIQMQLAVQVAMVVVVQVV